MQRGKPTPQWQELHEVSAHLLLEGERRRERVIEGGDDVQLARCRGHRRRRHPGNGENSLTDHPSRGQLVERVGDRLNLITE